MGFVAHDFREGDIMVHYLHIIIIEVLFLCQISPQVTPKLPLFCFYALLGALKL